MRDAAKRHATKLIALLLLAMLGFLWYRPPATVEDMDLPLPPLTVALFDGTVVGTETLRGKAVLINIWASWCPYCRKEMPAMESFFRDYAAKGFTILALSMDEEAQTPARFMRENGYSFPAGMREAAHRAALGDVPTLPTSFIVDAQGRVRHKIVGQLHYGRLEDLIVPLLPPQRASGPVTAAEKEK
jgi:thiol-disulfide isomerase/thioredoxin